MDNADLLQDLTDDEAQCIQGGADVSTQRTDLSINLFGFRIPPIQVTGSPFGGAGSALLAGLLGNPFRLTPKSSPVQLSLIFKTPGGVVIGGG